MGSMGLMPGVMQSFLVYCEQKKSCFFFKCAGGSCYVWFRGKNVSLHILCCYLVHVEDWECSGI